MKNWVIIVASLKALLATQRQEKMSAVMQWAQEPVVVNAEAFALSKVPNLITNLKPKCMFEILIFLEMLY